MRIEKPTPKLLYPLREVSRMSGVSPNVIKRWEVLFPQIKPVRNRAGNRSYLEKDLKLIFYIRDLLYVQHLSEEEVTEKLKHYQSLKDNENPAYFKQLLAEIKMEVEDIRDLLSD